MTFRLVMAGILLHAVLAAETMVSAADLQADVKILRSAYEQLHPGLYRYNTRQQMDARFDLLAKELNHAQPLREAYLAIARFTAAVECGHTYPNFFNQKKEVADEVFGGQTRVPFEFFWLDGEMVITRNHSGNTALKPGSRVTQINGIASKKVLATLLGYARADGSNINKRLDDLSVGSTSRFTAFDVFHPLLFPLKEPVFRLKVRDADTGKSLSVTVPAWSLAERVAALEGASVPEDDRPVWRFTMADEKTAYLRMPTWALYNSKWKWEAALNSFMDQLVAKGTPNLVIDLRGNEGGLDCGNVILSRLTGKDLALTKYRRKVRYRKTPAELNPYLDTWDQSFKDWGADAQEDTGGYYRLVETDGPDSPDVVKPRGPRYTGGVYVLMDASNSSATFQFEETLHRNRLGTLIGQAAGGNLRGINGGAFFFLRLPGSRIEVDLPLIGRFPDEPQPDATLAPDIAVARSARDVAQGIDGELKAALAAMKNR